MERFQNLENTLNTITNIKNVLGQSREETSNAGTLTMRAANITVAVQAGAAQPRRPPALYGGPCRWPQHRWRRFG